MDCGSWLWLGAFYTHCINLWPCCLPPNGFQTRNTIYAQFDWLKLAVPNALLQLRTSLALAVLHGRYVMICGSNLITGLFFQTSSFFLKQIIFPWKRLTKNFKSSFLLRLHFFFHLPSPPIHCTMPSITLTSHPRYYTTPPIHSTTSALPTTYDTLYNKGFLCTLYADFLVSRFFRNLFIGPKPFLPFHLKGY